MGRLLKDGANVRFYGKNRKLGGALNLPDNGLNHFFYGILLNYRLTSNPCLLLPPDQYTTLTDEDLLLRYHSSRNNEWLGYLLQRYTTLLLGVAMKYLKDRTLAEDAVQQVFLKALTHMPQGEMQNFKGWLYILMRNYCLQQLRDKSYNAGEAMLVNIPEKGTDLEEIQWKDNTLAQLEEAVEQLNEEQKYCLKAFYLQKQPYQAIMDKTGYSFAQVKSYIQNGKRNLKLILLQKQATGNG